MKINRLETHDRLEHFKKDQEISIWQGADGCMTKNPLSLALQEKSHYIYIFAHPRTDDDGFTKKMYWQPRLTKPEAQENSYLFRAISHTDILEIMWIIPPEDLWKQYQRGNITEEPTILWSINMFRFNKKELEQPEYDDLRDDKIRAIYQSLKQDKIKLVSEEACLTAPVTNQPYRWWDGECDTAWQECLIHSNPLNQIQL